MVNSGSLDSFPRDGPPPYSSAESNGCRSTMSDTTSENSPLVDAGEKTSPQAPTIVSSSGSDSSDSYDHGIQPSPSMPLRLSDADAFNLSHFFVVDSYNIHRLVIAGVTCASKFFSDVFYTNSRYAKVLHALPFMLFHQGLTLLRLGVYPCQSLITLSFNSSFSTTSAFPYPLMNSTNTELCLSSSTPGKSFSPSSSKGNIPLKGCTCQRPQRRKTPGTKEQYGPALSICHFDEQRHRFGHCKQT